MGNIDDELEKLLDEREESYVYLMFTKLGVKLRLELDEWYCSKILRKGKVSWIIKFGFIIAVFGVYVIDSVWDIFENVFKRSGKNNGRN